MCCLLKQYGQNPVGFLSQQNHFLCGQENQDELHGWEGKNPLPCVSAYRVEVTCLHRKQGANEADSCTEFSVWIVGKMKIEGLRVVRMMAEVLVVED